MNTPAHLIFAAAAFAQPQQRSRTVAAVLGALAPDVSLYVMAGVSLFLLGLSPGYVFDTLYFSDAWQRVFAIDNSFVLWGAGLVLAWGLKRPVWIVFAASALLHLAFDFPLHHDDARAHFWPLSDWVFHSPVSYWDVRHHARIVAPVELGLSLLGCMLLFWRFESLRSRVVIGVAVLFQLSPFVIWTYVFAFGA